MAERGHLRDMTVDVVTISGSFDLLITTRSWLRPSNNRGRSLYGYELTLINHGLSGDHLTAFDSLHKLNNRMLFDQVDDERK